MSFASKPGEMGKVEAVIWILGAVAVIGIVLYAMGAYDILSHMIQQMLADKPSAPSGSQ